MGNLHGSVGMDFRTSACFAPCIDASSSFIFLCRKPEEQRGFVVKKQGCFKCILCTEYTAVLAWIFEFLHFTFCAIRVALVQYSSLPIEISALLDIELLIC